MPNGSTFIDLSSINIIIQQQLDSLQNINISEVSSNIFIQYSNLYVLRNINICAFSNNYDTSIKLNKNDSLYYYTFNNNDILFSYNINN